MGIDGCMPIGSTVSLNGDLIGFSPFYCAPEWAHLVLKSWAHNGDCKMEVTHALSSWSIGILLCELVALYPVLESAYVKFVKGAFTHREACLLFLEWLCSSSRAAAMPSELERTDPYFYELLSDWLLVHEPAERKSMADCLTHSCISSTRSFLFDCSLPSGSGNQR